MTPRSFVEGLLNARPTGAEIGEPGEFYGFRPLPRRGMVVTNELIDELRESDPEG